jgi:hypothetical protein
VSEVISAVSEDKGDVDFEAVKDYHKIRREGNGI